MPAGSGATCLMPGEAGAGNERYHPVENFRQVRALQGECEMWPQ